VSADDLGRRRFLSSIGLLGVMATTGLVLPNTAGAAAGVLDRSQLDPTDVTGETFRGLAAFVVPGRDVYSVAQGTPRTAPGGVEAGTGDFLIFMFDHFLPVPDGTGATTMPLSSLVASMLNGIAPFVNPAAGSGRFPSAFANLFAPEKAALFSLLENPPPPVLDAILTEVPEQLRPAVGGLLPYLVGGLFTFSALGAYGEWSTFDPASRLVRSRPVGWDISGFDPGVLDGWDDLIGYYQGRKGVRG
jgi:hypothetical protein